MREVKAAAESEAAKVSQALVDTAKKTIANEKSAMLGLLNAKLDSTRTQVVAEIEGTLAKLAYVPLGMRVSAVVLDLVILWLATTAIRIGTEWGRGISEPTLMVAFFTVFSLRAFFSPGDLLLGISARRIGPDHRPLGQPGLKPRLICGLLHYGPLIATVVFAVLDEETASGLKNLVGWAFNPRSNTQHLPGLISGLLKPASPGLPAAVLASTFIWWIVLLVSILISPAIHRGTPYFRNTTLVEYIERIGFERFSLPAFKSPTADISS